MQNEIIFSGFGGQGALFAGQLCSYAAMDNGLEVTWIPSYGPEMRGGTANCTVIISNEEIGSPLVRNPSAVVAMNLPSLDKFEPLLLAGGNLIINSSLIDKTSKRKDINVYLVPSNDIANELGNVKTANMVVLGAIIAATKAVSKESVLKAFAKMFAKKPELLAINEKAINRGAALVEGK